MPTSEVAPLPQKQWREFCAEARKYRDEPVTRLCATLEAYHTALEGIVGTWERNRDCSLSPGHAAVHRIARKARALLDAAAGKE